MSSISPDRDLDEPKVGSDAVLRVADLDDLIDVLANAGYTVEGPVVRDGAVVSGTLRAAADLPRGVRDQQTAGHYRLHESDDDELFGWAVGPQSWKPAFFPAHQEVWRAVVVDGHVTIRPSASTPAPRALIGVRPCDVAALGVLDRVLAEGAYPDPSYVDRREGTFVVVVECGRPAATCFCLAMATGPGATGGYDLALTELVDPGNHRFYVRVGTARGAEVLARVRHEAATAADRDGRGTVVAAAEERLSQRQPPPEVRHLLGRHLDPERWLDVAGRCLSCGNCTLVCPTCFCSDVRDVSDIAGTLRRERTWASCFDLDHSYLHGGAVRASAASRYRQWLTHKFSTWWDQFDTSGCVGCGRCVTWCPGEIDVVDETLELARFDAVSQVQS